VRVAHDLKGEVVFVGAFAVVCHIGPYRQTRDIDFALAAPVSYEKFEKLGYRVFVEGGKKVVRTGEGVKIDAFTRDISGIPVSRIFETAVDKQLEADKVRIICIEALLIAKMRAARPQDIADVQELCRRRGKSIHWDIVDSVATSVESAELRNVVAAFSGRQN
jgi:predicted nucleotidyltransferase